MKDLTAREIINQMSEIYTEYRTSPYNEDWEFIEWLMNMKIGDRVIDLFIAADDLREEWDTLES